MIRPSSAALALVCLAGIAHAEPVEDPCACSPNKPGFYRKGALTGDWRGRRDKLRDDGVIIQAVYAGEVFAGSGLRDGSAVAGLGVVSADLDLAKLVDDSLGSVHLSGLGIHGNGLSAQLMDVYGVSNNVAPNDVRLFEAWIEQPIKLVTVRAGLISADQEFVLAGHSTALINATFGIISQLSYNLLGPVYPVAAPGVSVRAEGGSLTARAAVYDGDQHNTHGVPTELGSNGLAIGEVEVEGTFKLGAWHHTLRGNGYYAIVDRRLDRYVGAFARISDSPAQPVDLYIDAGIRIGPGPLRARDFASVGLAFAHTERGPQTAIELTYQLQLGWLTIQPDVQLVLTRDHNVAMFATRAIVVL